MTTPVAAPLTPELIARRSGSSFLVSFACLTPDRRRALTAIYAFCRVADDAADDAPDAEQARAELLFWQRELDRIEAGEPRTPLGAGVLEAVRAFGVDTRHLRSVLEGVACDVEPPVLETLADLERYCFLVASSVGLACLPVFGAEGESAERYADELGHALQLTNIARDLRADALEGRVYVPRAWLAELGLEPRDLTGAGRDELYGAGGGVEVLVRRLAAAAHLRYRAAREAAAPELLRKLLPAEVMGAVYLDLLRQIERRGGQVCRGGKVRVRRLRKLWIAWRTRREVARRCR